MKFDWILCPICGNKARNRIGEDTILKNFPLYCLKCKQETLIEAKNLQITVKFAVDDLHRPVTNIVHPTNPRHLIF